MKCDICFPLAAASVFLSALFRLLASTIEIISKNSKIILYLSYYLCWLLMLLSYNPVFRESFYHCRQKIKFINKF